MTTIDLDAPVPATLDEIVEQMSGIVDAADGRTLTGQEADRYEQLEAALQTARRDREIRARQQAYMAPVAANVTPAVSDASPDRPSWQRVPNPLAVSDAAMAGIAHAMRTRTGGRFAHDLTREQLFEISNAALTTGTYGQPTTWGANVTAGPRILHVAAGVPRQDIDAVAAEFPQLTVPAAVAAAAEGAALAEYASSTGGVLTLGRFGRYTDRTAEAQIGTDYAALVAMHAVGAAKDLDNALFTAWNTAAGSAVAFAADVPAAVRKGIARCIDATAASSADRIVVGVHPDNADLLQDVTPTGGETIGEGFQRFSGALVYPSSAVPTGFALIGNPSAGARYFEAQGFGTAVDIADVKTGTETVASFVIAGYALVGVGTNVWIKQDIVTP